MNAFRILIFTLLLTLVKGPLTLNAEIPPVVVEGGKIVLTVAITKAIEILPWGETWKAAEDLINGRGGTTGTQSVELKDLHFNPKLVVYEAIIETEVSKKQSDWYGSITCTRKVESRVSYTVNLVEAQLTWSEQERVLHLEIPDIVVDSIDSTRTNYEEKFTRLRKRFSADTRLALLKTLEDSTRQKTRKKAEEQLPDVRKQFLVKMQETAKSRFPDAKDIKVVVKYAGRKPSPDENNEAANKTTAK